MNTKSLERFRGLFAEEAEARLERIHQLLLEIDDVDANADPIGEIFREVHTLKGSAAVVGFEDLSRFAHALEERLEVMVGSRSITPAIVDALLAAADDLGRLTAASLAGEDAEDMMRLFEARLVETAEVGAAPAQPPSVIPEAVDRPAAEPIERTVAEPATAPRRDTTRARPRSSILVPVERLDDLVRLAGEAASANVRVGRMIRDRLGVEATRATELVALSRLLNDLQERAMRTRMVPVTTITDQLRRAVRDIARAVGKEVRWEVDGGETELDRSVLQELADSLLHVVRNAVDHGIESPEERVAAGKPAYGTVRLNAMQVASEVIISVSDDGRGIDVANVRAKAARQGHDVDDLDDDEALQLIFRSGISTARFLTDISGRGVGLDVVRASVESARGRIEIHSEAGLGTELRLIVPITLSVLPCLLVDAGGQRFALPMHRVVVVHDRIATITHAEGRRVLWVDEEPVTVTLLSEVLGHHDSADLTEPTGPIVVVSGTLHRHAFQVTALVGQGDVVIKALSAVLPRLQVIAGASVDPDGSVLVILDPPGLVDLARQSSARWAMRPTNAAPTPTARHILVVDDALTVRELQRSILERAGYNVSVAADGVEAVARLASGDIELVLTDVQMPRMDGFALTRAIRDHATTANLPVVILTSMSSDQDRQHGLDAGADGYIVKSDYDETSLLHLVERMLGDRS